MIPIADENPTRRRPYVVYILIVINVLAFIVDRVGATGSFGTLWNFTMIPYSVVNNVPIPFEDPLVRGNVVVGTQGLLLNG